MTDVALAGVCPTTAKVIELYGVYGFRFGYLTLNQKLELIALCAHLLRHGADWDGAPCTGNLPIKLIQRLYQVAEDQALLTRVMRCTSIVLDESRFDPMPPATTLTSIAA
ncbi:MAG: hypothetical protein RLZZ511_4120 [Cyanobacteriota bacterium]|jgi:hypothetical protein